MNCDSYSNFVRFSESNSGDAGEATLDDTGGPKLFVSNNPERTTSTIFGTSGVVLFRN